MRSYPAENWKELGKWIHDARLRAGWTDMKEWASHVERSTRQLQGLERGEPVGEKTLVNVARGLNRDIGVLIDILAETEESLPKPEQSTGVRDPLDIDDDAEAMQEFLRQRAYRKGQRDVSGDE